MTQPVSKEVENVLGYLHDCNGEHVTQLSADVLKDANDRTIRELRITFERPVSSWDAVFRLAASSPRSISRPSKDAQTHGVGDCCTLLCDPWQTGFFLVVTKLGGPFVRINLSFVGCDEEDFITMANANDQINRWTVKYLSYKLLLCRNYSPCLHSICIV
ncbi:hypothetical protein PAAG_12244 [Paracoccidioides lutzii Pb01]|uniref:Uncharacterized protein n=1 Tax=Paracoccidioides lutzii (strain ATCC MYA-826 / Pb01) TaxID=502779 RepID=A0A0A2UZQ6_PARBA|nr:hypothetical protein PAAG_12244 [Paracoccidioides lutzii Pb01]KGQ01051.1 hypothetical protein PAAG_12244 [Paracoccidioides lutzii Pb01]